MYNYNKKLNGRAKEMRKNMTPHENKLWYQFLNNYKPKFMRQRVIGNYIADFYCSKAKLVVELDGKHHEDENNKEYDVTRDGFLTSLGIKVIRIKNNEIDSSFQTMCEYIDREVKVRM